MTSHGYSTAARAAASRATVALVSLALGLATAGAFATAAPASHGLDLAGIDRSVTPGADFFAYANGAWLKATEIPPDRSTYGAGAMLAELTAERTAALIQGATTSGSPAGSEARKVGDYYASFMDEAAIEKKGLQPLQPALERIGALSDRRDLARMLGETLRADVDVLNNTRLHTANLFGLWVAQDLNDPSRYAPFLLQGGLGMPDRDYYLNPSPHMAAVRAKYQAHIAAVLKLARLPDAQAKAGRILDLEHRIAEAHWSRAESEDVLKGNNHWARKEFEQRAPGLDWQAYFAAAGLDRQAEFVVWQPSALTGLAALVVNQPLESWKDYLQFHALEDASPYLPKAFVDEQFAFYGSFDDQGALFDASGRLDNWWTKEDFAHFQAAAARLADQYNGYRPFPDLAVNGKQTLSENIADVAGLAVAYDAYKLTPHGAAEPAVAGLNGDQLFFLSFAQSWPQKIREPALRQRIVTDGHAPAEYRADTVRNLDAWYVAFDVKPGQALYLTPTDRVHVW